MGKDSAFRTTRLFVLGVTIGAFSLIAAASIASGQPRKIPTIEPLDLESRKKLVEQREFVATLARRYVGSTLTGQSISDLRIVQRLYDRLPTRDRGLAPFKERAVPDKRRIYEIQALGVVLGDVMAHNFELQWVVFEDKYGRGRALNVEGTKDLVFPVTMLSKRYEKSLPVDVKALYDDIAATLSKKPKEPVRRKMPIKPRILTE